MKLLIDNALSPRLSELLAVSGHDVVHVRDRGLHAAADTSVFETAASEDRILISADTDFGALLAVRREVKPSFILLRNTTGLDVYKVATTITDILNRFEQDLTSGCVITVTDERIRVRSLPIG